MNKPVLAVDVLLKWMNTEDMQGLAVTACREAKICSKCEDKPHLNIYGYSVVLIDWTDRNPLVEKPERVIYGLSLIWKRVQDFDEQEGWRYE